MNMSNTEKTCEAIAEEIEKGKDVFYNKLSDTQIKDLKDYYERTGWPTRLQVCFSCTVFTDDWMLIGEGYECMPCSELNRTDYENRKWGDINEPYEEEE